MVQGSKLSKLAKLPNIPRISKLAARPLVVTVAFLIAFVGSRGTPLGPDTASADPLTDSFATGGKRPARRPAKPASKGGGGSRSGSKKPAAPASNRRPRVKTQAPPAADRTPAPEEEEDAPRREVPEDSPRARRATESDESRSSSDEGDGRRSDANDEADDDERPHSRSRTKARAVPARRTVVTKAQKKRGDDSDEERGEDSDGADNDGADNDEDANEDEGPSAESLPSIAPRAVALALGVGLMGRTFEFAAPAQLQRERSFGRLGYTVDVETFPLRLASKGWWQRIGLGFSYAAEPIGQASVNIPSNGSTVETPVDQSRWSVDLRAALPLGARVVVTPRLGLESSSFTLATKMPVMASTCLSTTTVACLPDTSAKLLAAGAILRVGATPDLGFWLGAAYLVSLHVDNKPLNQIGYEIGTSATGLALDLGASLRFADWLAVRANIPITRIGYAFHPAASTPAAVNYRSASELVWGFGAALAVFTN